MKFEDLKFNAHPNGMGGIQATHTFPNGFGVSVIQASFSYGGDQGLYEMAILFKDRITYDTPITDDVLGRLTKEDVTKHLAEVEALTASDLKEKPDAPSSPNPVDLMLSLGEIIRKGGKV